MENNYFLHFRSTVGGIVHSDKYNLKGNNFNTFTLIYFLCKKVATFVQI